MFYSPGWALELLQMVYVYIKKSFRFWLINIFLHTLKISRMEKVTLNLLEIRGKARSKYELYNILTCEGHLYLPPFKYCSVNFMADILEGKIKVCFRHLHIWIISKCRLLIIRTSSFAVFLTSEVWGLQICLNFWSTIAMLNTICLQNMIRSYSIENG